MCVEVGEHENEPKNTHIPYAQDFYGRELQAWMINDMVANIALHVARGVLRKSSFLGNLKLSDKKLGHRRTPT